MKAIFKNFVHVLRRFKTASLLNILGLSAALVVFTVCAIQTYYDLTFNGHIKNADRLYQLSLCQETNYGKAWRHNMSHRYSDIVRLNQPMFDEASMVRVICIGDKSGVQYNRDGEQISAEVMVTSVEPQFLDIIGMDIVEGDGKSALADINKIIISKETAKRFFGNESPIGKSLLMSMPITFEYENGGLDNKWEEVPMTIGAVYKDFPTNTSFTNGVFTCLMTERYERFSADGNSVSFGNKFNTYCLLNTEVSLDVAEKVLSDEELLDLLSFNTPRVEDIKDAQGEGAIEVFNKSLKLLPLPNIHISYPETVRGKAKSWESVLSLLVIGVVALLIAYINFMNFITAMAPTRIRSINIQKIMGARRISLSFSIVFETLIFSFLAFAIALLIVSFVSTSAMSEFFTASLQLGENMGLIAALAIVLICISVLVASYPAYSLTSFNPITTYGGATMGQKGKQMRSILTIIQFVAACVLIMVASFIKLQHEYFKSHNMGIDKENIIIVTNHSSTYEPLLSSADVYMQEASTIDGITNSTSANFQFGGLGVGGKGRGFDGKQVSYSNISVSKNFLDFFDIKVLEGANLINDKNQDRICVVNKTMLAKYGEEIIKNDRITNGRFAVVDDFNYKTLYEDVSPLLIDMVDSPGFMKIYFKVKGSETSQVIKHMEDTWQKLTSAPFEYHFLDQELDKYYKAESNLSKLLSVFALTVILIAIMGVYGLITFNSKYRAKEIAIRKVQGSTIEQIMLLLNRGMLTQFVVAFVISTPIAYYIVGKWLEQFPYKVPVYWWVFLLGALVVLLITVFTVSVQSYRAATANPIGALKEE